MGVVNIKSKRSVRIFAALLLFITGLGLVSTDQVSAVNPNNLISEWQLDETSGSIAPDRIGNTANGTFEGTADWVSGMYLHQAAGFDGASNIQTNRTNVNGSATLRAWVRPTALADGASPLGWTKSGAGGGHEFIDMQNSPDGYHWRAVFRGNNSGPGEVTITSSDPIDIDTWAHLVITTERTASSTIVRFYVNQNLQGTVTYNEAPGPVDMGSLYIGRAGQPAAHYFTGDVDDVRVYNTVLNAQEIYDSWDSYAPRPVIRTPIANTTYDSQLISLDFDLFSTPVYPAMYAYFTSSSGVTLLVLDAFSAGSHDVTIDRSDPMASPGGAVLAVYGNPTIGDGVYDVHIGFQDSYGTSRFGVGLSPVSNTTSGVRYGPPAAAITTQNPANGAQGIAPNSPLTLKFNQPMEIGTGDIDIYKTNGDTLVETIPVTSPAVTGSGTDTITIQPTQALSPDTSYYVLIDAGAFEDAGGQPFAGFASSSGWTFTTAAAAIGTNPPSSTNPLIPGVPNTGLPSARDGSTIGLVMATGSSAVVIVAYVIRKMRRRRSRFSQLPTGRNS